jgi:hypothetical protein
VMGDVPINYIEGIGGTRVSEEDIVAVGKHDVSFGLLPPSLSLETNIIYRFFHSRSAGKA